MTAAADRLFTNAEIHALTAPDTVHEALAVRDGEIVRLGDADEVAFLAGVETDVIDCEGRVVVPGFIDAHTHMEQLGQHLVHADLSEADSVAECLELLAAEAERTDDSATDDSATDDSATDDSAADDSAADDSATDDSATDDSAADDSATDDSATDDSAADDSATDGREDDWILGFGYDESEWDGRSSRLTRDDLDSVSDERPVAALRVDLHTVSLNSVALERFADDLPDADLEYEDGEPTGVAVEDAAEVVRREVAAGREEMREVLSAAAEYAVERGVTGVHDKVRNSTTPRVYRDLAAGGDLPLRVRIDYWSDYLESLVDVGLTTNAGNGRVQTGAIKSFSDGSIGSRTAKLSEPYADANDADGDGPDETDGQWVVDPDDLRALVDRADAAGFQLSVHAIGDEAIDETLAALESALENAAADPGRRRHRIEHAELATDDQLERMAQAGVVASMQPNFHRWADEGGLYDRRLGRERRNRTNRFRRVLEAGVPLAFGSDCMPLDPLLGIHHAVNAPAETQRLSVTEALRAYTHGAAYAGFDEDRVGTVAVGKRADLVVLEESPWERSDRIDEIDVAMTVVDGEVVFDGRGG